MSHYYDSYGYPSFSGPAERFRQTSERFRDELRTVQQDLEDAMRIRATPDSVEIQLDATERRTLRKAAGVLATLAKHEGSEELKKLADAFQPVAAKWGKEEE